jgi:hypothetical protein
MAVSRDKLSEEVWAEPMTTVAARYEVSSSFLARVCERLNVPRPARGYWAQLKVGKAPERPALPEARPGDELEWSRDGEPRRVPRALPKAPAAAPAKRPRLRGERPSRHALLVGAREHFDNVRESDRGYLRPFKKLLVDVFVSKDTLSRALEAANTLFLALEDRGHHVVFAPSNGPYRRPDVDPREEAGRAQYISGSWTPARPTVVFVGTVAIGLTFFELSEEVEVQWVDSKYVRVAPLPAPKRRGPAPAPVWTHKQDMPSGRLCLRASSPYPGTSWERLWREANAGDLPGKFAAIVKELERDAAPIAKLVEEAERQAELERQRWEVQQREWRREEAERQRVQAIKESREQLFAIIDAWGVAKRIEAFFDDAERRSANLGNEDRGALVDRLHRARELLGGVDALQRFRSWKAPEER